MVPSTGNPSGRVGVALAETLPSHSAEVTLGCRRRLCDLERVTQTPEAQSVQLRVCLAGIAAPAWAAALGVR